MLRVKQLQVHFTTLPMYICANAHAEKRSLGTCDMPWHDLQRCRPAAADQQLFQAEMPARSVLAEFNVTQNQIFFYCIAALLYVSLTAEGF